MPCLQFQQSSHPDMTFLKPIIYRTIIYLSQWRMVIVDLDPVQGPVPVGQGWIGGVCLAGGLPVLVVLFACMCPIRASALHDCLAVVWLLPTRGLSGCQPCLAHAFTGLITALNSTALHPKSYTLLHYTLKTHATPRATPSPALVSCACRPALVLPVPQLAVRVLLL